MPVGRHDLPFAFGPKGGKKMANHHRAMLGGNGEEPNRPDWSKLLAAIAQVIMALARLFHDL